jgi:SHS family lactate transporter-like MFS transporter
VHSITCWYPTLLSQMHRTPLPFLLAFNVGAIVGAVVCGRLSETLLGRRGAATVATLIGVLVIPLYVFATSATLLWTGALAMGFFGAGNFGIVPAYLTERFPTVARAVGAGFAYHVGAGFGSFTPTIVGALSDRGPACDVAGLRTRVS